MLFHGIMSNICIMITGFYLITKLTHEPLSPTLSVGKKVQLGITTGLLGYILMLSAVPAPISDQIILDFRHVPLIIISCYVGGLPALIACIIIAVARLQFGLSATAISVSLTYLMLGLILYFSDKYVSRVIKVRGIIFSIITMLCICINYLLFFSNDKIVALKFILIMTISSTIALVIVFIFMKDLRQQTVQFHSYREQAEIDFLTGLKNKRIFTKKIEVLLQFSYDTTLLVIDVDKFKSINDRYGHDGGDAVLKQLATVMKTHCHNNQEPFRVGGEEFAVILTQMTPEQSYQMAEELRQAIEASEFILPDEQGLKVTISIGISQSPIDGKTINELYRKADMALYRAKYQGRNQVVVYQQQDFDTENNSPVPLT